VEDITDDPLGEELYGLFLKIKDSPRHISIKAETLFNEVYDMSSRLEHDKNPSEHLEEYAKDVERNLGWHYGVDLVFPMSYAVLKCKKRQSKKVQILLETIEHRYRDSIYWETFTQRLFVKNKRKIRKLSIDTEELLQCLKEYHGIPYIQVQQADIYVNSPGNIVSKEIKYK
jgi:hypothetical protein